MKTFIALLLFIISHQAVSAVGVVSAMRGEADLIRNDQSSPLALNTQIEKEDGIKTGAKTKVQVTFKDRTVITIGRNSSVLIADYLHDNADNSKFQGTLTKGFMRTMTGKIGKLAPSRFKIKTKTATIGIRGTIFTVQVSEEETTVATLSGETFLQVDQTGNTYTVPQNQQVTYNNQTWQVTVSEVENPQGDEGSNESNNEESSEEDNSESTEESGSSTDSSVEGTNDSTATEASTTVEQSEQSASEQETETEVLEQTNNEQQDQNDANDGNQDDGGTNDSVVINNAYLTTMTDSELNDLEAQYIAQSYDNVSINQQTVGGDLNNEDSPYEYGYWRISVDDDYNNTYNFVVASWARGKVTQETIDAINRASDNLITGYYSADISGYERFVDGELLPDSPNLDGNVNLEWISTAVRFPVKSISSITKTITDGTSQQTPPSIKPTVLFRRQTSPLTHRPPMWKTFKVRWKANLSVKIFLGRHKALPERLMSPEPKMKKFSWTMNLKGHTVAPYRKPNKVRDNK